MTAPDVADHVLGDPDAAVTLLEYGDYECPYCAAAAPVLRQVVEDSGGLVRLVFRNFPLADVHPFALTAALAAEAAGAQGAFWAMHELLFERQDRLDDAALRAYAEELGLDGEPVVGEPAQVFGDKVEADFAAGLAAGVGGHAHRLHRRAAVDGARGGRCPAPGDRERGVRGERISPGRTARPRAGAAASVVPRSAASTARTAPRGPAAGRPRRPLQLLSRPGCRSSPARAGARR